eukprot:4874109-Pyramimonas_sp.AAC.1
MAREAIRHLNIIVRHYRKLSGRGGKRLIGGSVPNQRPSCATIPRSEDLVESRQDRGQHAELGGVNRDDINNECNQRKGVG